MLVSFSPLLFLNTHMVAGVLTALDRRSWSIHEFLRIISFKEKQEARLARGTEVATGSNTTCIVNAMHAGCCIQVSDCSMIMGTEAVRKQYNHGVAFL